MGRDELCEAESKLRGLIEDLEKNQQQEGSQLWADVYVKYANVLWRRHGALEYDSITYALRTAEALDPGSALTQSMLDTSSSNLREHTFQDSCSVKLSSEFRARQLDNLMSALSQKCWYASWLKGSEYPLWEFANDARAVHRWGAGVVSQSEAARLKELSKMAGGWIIWERGQDMPRLVPLKEWLGVYASWKNKVPSDVLSQVSNRSLKINAAEADTWWLHPSVTGSR